MKKGMSFRSWLEAMVAAPVAPVAGAIQPPDPQKQQIKTQLAAATAQAIKTGQDPKLALKNAIANIVQAGKIDPKKVLDQLPDEDKQIPGQPLKKQMKKK